MNTRKKTRPLRFAYLCMCASLLVTHCGGAQTRSTTADDAPALNLELARAHGDGVTLAALRGKPCLLFFFATYDGASQVALSQLERFLLGEKRLRVLGIAIQPDAKAFLEPYANALNVSFPLFYDPHNAILGGDTELGKLDFVPSFVILDADGHIRGRLSDVATPADLQHFVADVVAR